MQSFQARVLLKIADAAEAYGADVSQSANYGNCGTINIHPAGEIVPAIVIAYDFQPGTYNLDITHRGVKIPSQIGRADYFAFYQRTDEPSRFWECLVAALRREFPKEKIAANATKARTPRVRIAKAKA